MAGLVKWGALAAVAAIATVSSASAWAQDAAKAVENRQAVMKAQGKATGTIRGFTEDKADLAAAQAAGADLVKEVAKIPSLFPAGTSMTDLPGKSFAKPAIWTEMDKFLNIASVAKAKAEALDAALKGGDKDKIKAALGDMGKNGCGACHEPYREKKPS